MNDYEDITRTNPESEYDSLPSDEEDDATARNSLDGILNLLYRNQKGNLDNVDKRRGIFPRLLQEVRQNTEPDAYEDEGELKQMSI